MAGINRLAEADRLAWGAVAATAVASLSGLILTGLYRDGDAMSRLTRADDSFRLLVVLPILAIGLWAGARGSVSGRLVSMGALACLCYLYAFVVSAVAINAMTLAHVAAFGLSFWALRPARLSVATPVATFRATGRRDPWGGATGREHLGLLQGWPHTVLT